MVNNAKIYLHEDLSIFLSMTKKFTHSIPIVIYFHENQLTYPLREGQLNEENLHYAFINVKKELLHILITNSTAVQLYQM